MPQELNLMDAARKFVDQCTEQLVSIDTSMLTDAAKTGKCDTKSSANSVTSSLSQFMEGVEYTTNEDGDLAHAPTEEEKNILFNRVMEITEAADCRGGGLPRKLCKKSASTEGKHRTEFCRLMLFVSRASRHFLDPDTTTALADRLKVFSSAVCHTDDGRRKALGVIASMTLVCLDLHTECGYADMVLKRPSLPAMCAMAMTVDCSLKKNDDFCYRLDSPEQLHSHCSAVLHPLRVSCLGCFVHAALTNDVELQRILPNIGVLCRARAVLDVSMLGRVCKECEGFTSRGVPPATHTVGQNGEDAFKLRHAREKSKHLVTPKRAFRTASQRGCSEIQESMQVFLSKALAGKTTPVKTPDGVLDSIVLEGDNMKMFFRGLFQTTSVFYECGVHRQCVEEVLQKRRRDGSLKSIELHGSTTSARFFMTHPNGSELTVESYDVSKLLADALQGSLDLRVAYDNFDFEVRTVFGALMHFAMRGSPRSWEELLLKCGETNEGAVKSFRASVTPSPSNEAGPGFAAGSGNLDTTSRLSCSFKRKKFGGAVKDTGFMGLPETVGHHLGVFLSVFHSAAAEVIAHPAAPAGATPKELLSMQSRAGTNARLFLVKFFTRAKLSAATPTHTTWPSLDKTIGRKLERLFNLPNESLNLGTFRQLMCGVSTFQEELMRERGIEYKKIISELRARGFNHGPRVHTEKHTECHQISNQLIAHANQTLNDRMDAFHHEWIGADRPLLPLLDRGVDVAVERWRRPRLINDEDSLGLLRLGSSIGYEMRSPYQRMLLTDPISMARDCLVVAPCNSGKTSCIIAAPLCAQLCVLARLSEQEKRQWLVSRLPRNADVPVDDLLQDRHIGGLLDFCLKDDAPPPANRFTVCIVPHVVACEDLVRNINSMQLVRATPWRDDEVEAAVARAAEAGDFSRNHLDFDVLVVTAAKAVTPKVRALIEKCFAQKIACNLVCDESHCLVTDISYMACLGVAINLPRRGVPLVLLTGSFPDCLTESLARVSQSSFGRDCSSWRNYTMEESVASDDNGSQFLSSYVENNGVWRPSNTVPTNVAHSVFVLPGWPSERKVAGKIKEMTSRMRDAQHVVEGYVVEKILVVCGTVKMAKAVAAELAGEAVMLLGSSVADVDPNQMKIFQEKWVNGNVRIGVGTTVLAQCINQEKCNLVVCVDLLFNMLTHLQASSRGGRRKQRSLSVMLSRESKISNLGKWEKNFAEERCWGVDVDRPGVTRALSPESLVGLLVRDPPLCRRECTKEEIDVLAKEEPADSSSSATLVVPVESAVTKEWCCDTCSAPIRQFVGSLFSERHNAQSTWSRECVAVTPRQEQHDDDPEHSLNVPDDSVFLKCMRSMNVADGGDAGEANDPVSGGGLPFGDDDDGRVPDSPPVASPDTYGDDPVSGGGLPFGDDDDGHVPYSPPVASPDTQGVVDEPLAEPLAAQITQGDVEESPARPASVTQGVSDEDSMSYMHDILDAVKEKSEVDKENRPSQPAIASANKMMRTGPSQTTTALKNKKKRPSQPAIASAHKKMRTGPSQTTTALKNKKKSMAANGDKEKGRSQPTLSHWLHSAPASHEACDTGGTERINNPTTVDRRRKFKNKTPRPSAVAWGGPVPHGGSSHNSRQATAANGRNNMREESDGTSLNFRNAPPASRENVAYAPQSRQHFVSAPDSPRFAPKEGSLNEEDLVRAFVTVTDRELLNECVWHHGSKVTVKPHYDDLRAPTVNDRNSNCCRNAYLKFLRLDRKVLCFHCGDDPFKASHYTKPPKGKTRGTCRLGFYKFGNKDYCETCGVHNEVGKGHSSDGCPRFRLWGLVVWAFRTPAGHRLMNDEWGNACPTNVQGQTKCPQIVRFGDFSPERQEKWQACLDFLVKDRLVNYHFWRNMRTVLVNIGKTKH